MSNWYLQNGNESDVVICTKVSLARNIDGFKFENKCSENDKKSILDLIESRYLEIGYGLSLLKIKDMDIVTQKTLVEKHLVTKEFYKHKSEYKAILLNDEENICIMINEEEHLKIQVFSEGLSIQELKDLIVEIDKKIEKIIPYMYDEKYGYLTECPINIGTGMKVSTFVHLPALVKTKNLSKIIRVINNFAMNVSGEYGENAEMPGDIYQITNNVTLGISEDEIVKNVKSITERVILQERTARQYLEKNAIELENTVYRAFGLLKYSKILSMDECLELLSTVKLGVDLGIITELDDKKVLELMIYTKSAFVQKKFGEVMKKNDEDLKRVEVIANILK